MKKIKITIGNVVVNARLLSEEAPKTVKLLESNVPLVGKLNHAKICDNEVFFQVPFFLDEVENPVYSEPGHIGYWGARQTICIWYANMIPLGNSNLFGIIEPEDLLKFASEAEKVWDNPGKLIKFEIIDI